MQAGSPVLSLGLFAALALLAVIALVAGVAVGWTLARRSAAAEAQAAAERLKAEAGTQVAVLAERAKALELERQALAAELHELRAQAAAERDTLDRVRDEKAQLAERASRVAVLEHENAAGAARLEQLRAQVAELGARLDAERAQAQDKLALLLAARDELSHQFRTLANDILEEKSRKFAEQNQTSLSQLLDPLRTRLQEFQGRVETLYDTEGKERSALAQQVVQLLDLNRTLADEAKNLTSALKGSVKAQGNWGELILERVLEACGLRKGVEYDTQASASREDGSRAQADVVIRLPEDRNLVVDAKVSLLAYEEYAGADDEAQRLAARRRHLESIRAHVKGLSERNYQLLYGLKSLDFVLMFVPIEPAFLAAVNEDSTLFMDAWNRNVLLVSPSTLMFVLRTVAHLWRQEAQSRNAQDIARRGAELYDRLTAFVADLERVGRNLKQAQDAYSDAFDKLAKNRGNVIRQAELLKQLGVKPTKSLPGALVEGAGVEGGEFDPS